MSGGAGVVFETLIAEQVTEERARKESLERRGMLVITSSGAITSLLLGLAAIFTTVEGYTAPPSSRAVLVFSVFSFVAAASLGLAANWPRSYDETKVSDLERLVEDDAYWTTYEGDLARQDAAKNRVAILRDARNTNETKAWFLIAALTLEVVAILLVAIAAAAIVMA